MVVDIDPADVGVAERIVEIQRAAYAVEAQLIGFDGIPQLAESAVQVRSDDSLEWRGAFDGDLLVGVIAWVEAHGQIDIDRLAVDPSAARQGHGRQLVQSVPEGRPTIVSTGAENVPAVTLYTSMGFEHVGQTEVAPGVFLAHLSRD